MQIQAAQYLDSILTCADIDSPCHTLSNVSLPYIVLQSPIPLSVTRAPCRGTPCLLETSIHLLPEAVTFVASAAEEILQVQESNRESLGVEKTMHYLNFPPSHAVDGKSNTAFCSPESECCNYRSHVEYTQMVGRR